MSSDKRFGRVYNVLSTNHLVPQSSIIRTAGKEYFIRNLTMNWNSYLMDHQISNAFRSLYLNIRLMHTQKAFIENQHKIFERINCRESSCRNSTYGWIYRTRTYTTHRNNQADRLLDGPEIIFPKESIDLHSQSPDRWNLVDVTACLHIGQWQ